MVRVVCQNFQRPRSRHSSGESPYSVDTDLARRAAEALSKMTTSDRRRLDSDAETSSDVYWDSDGQWENGTSDSGTEPAKNQNELVKKRKARRRERNKMSAQSYRQRKKEQNVSQQKILTQLEDHQRDLLDQIKQLELEKVQVEKFLRTCYVDNDVTKPETPQTVPVAFVANYNNSDHRNNNLCHNTNIPEIMSMS